MLNGGRPCCERKGIVKYSTALLSICRWEVLVQYHNACASQVSGLIPLHQQAGIQSRANDQVCGRSVVRHAPLSGEDKRALLFETVLFHSDWRVLLLGDVVYTTEILWSRRRGFLLHRKPCPFELAFSLS